MEVDLTLLNADEFDARRGFTRWVLPGTGVVLPGQPQANADVWTNRDGRLFARFSSAGYIFHYEIVSTTHHPISEDLEDAVREFLLDRLVTWVMGGVDDSVVNM